MAFARQRINKICTIGAATMEAPENSVWMYVTTDTKATVLGADYFDVMAKKGMIAGDFILVHAGDGKQDLVVHAADAVAGTVTVKPTASVSGQATTVAAADTIVTGMDKVTAVIAGFDSDPGDNPEFVSASIGDQNGAPAAGSFYLKTWQNTAGNDPTPTAATTFGKKINWIALGESR